MKCRDNKIRENLFIKLNEIITESNNTERLRISLQINKCVSRRILWYDSKIDLKKYEKCGKKNIKSCKYIIYMKIVWNVFPDVLCDAKITVDQTRWAQHSVTSPRYNIVFFSTEVWWIRITVEAGFFFFFEV